MSTAAVCGYGQTIVVSFDQTSLRDDRAIGMVSMGVGERALPLFWIVRRTAGNIAIKDYLPLPDRLKSCLTKDSKVLILADQFFGTPELIAACQCHGWSWCIRLKVNLTLHHDGGGLSVSDIASLGKVVTGANLCDSIVLTNIVYVHDRGHKEAWFIAMDAQPTRKKRLATACAGASRACSLISNPDVLAFSILGYSVRIGSLAFCSSWP